MRRGAWSPSSSVGVYKERPYERGRTIPLVPWCLGGVPAPLRARGNQAEGGQDDGVVWDDFTEGILETRHGAAEAVRAAQANLLDDFAQAWAHPLESEKCYGPVGVCPQTTS